MNIRLLISLFAAVIIYFIVIIQLLKKKLLSVKYSLMWFLAGILFLILLLFPNLLVRFAALTGVQSHMNCLYTATIGFSLCIIMSLTVIVTRLNDRITKLSQTVSRLEKQMNEDKRINLNQNEKSESADNQLIWEGKWSRLGEYATKSGGNRWAFYLIRKLSKKMQIANGVIIDVGCGIGNKTAVLARDFPKNQVYGVDFSKEGIAFAKQYYKEVDNVDFICQDAIEFARTKKTLEGKTIELVSAFELIEHIDDWESFLTDLCNMTDKYIMLSTPTGRMREYEIPMGHYRNFQKGELESFLEEQGFERVEVLYAGFPFWSPLTRDLLNHKTDPEEQDDMLTALNPLVHECVYLLYRFFTFNHIGDQFVCLYRKRDN